MTSYRVVRVRMVEICRCWAYVWPLTEKSVPAAIPWESRHPAMCAAAATTLGRYFLLRRGMGWAMAVIGCRPIGDRIAYANAVVRAFRLE